MTEYLSTAARIKRQPGRRRVDLTPKELVAVVGALQQSLLRPDADHITLRAILIRLTS